MYTIGRNELPPLLQEIGAPPVRLFVRGTLPSTADYANKKFLCVVGSRRASQYGIDTCQKLIQGLAGSDIIIVSGLALGIDGAAHEAALKAGLPTIAVLASGLDDDSIYPAAHQKLAKEIISSGQGALLSEFPPGYAPFRHNFPERNRIMVGLSQAVLIIEASQLSGTLITARLALEENRDVFAVPGSIFSAHSEGPNRLIWHGATPIQDSTDILYGLYGVSLPAEFSEDSNEIRTENNLQNRSHISARQLANCTAAEIRIHSLLEQPLSRAEIFHRLDRDFGILPSEATVALSQLEMKKLVIESGGELRRNG